MSQDSFAFIIHPIQIKKDVKRKFPFLGTILPEPIINYASRYFPPLYISEITGVQSVSTHNELKGWFLACPFTPPTMMALPVDKVYKKIIQTGQLAEELGAKMLGLGAFTSVVGDAGLTIAQGLDIPVTTGDSFTVAIAIEALEEAARLMGHQMDKTTVAIVGATGSIGKACARLLAERCEHLILIGRREDAVQAVRESCEGYGASIIASTDMDQIYSADLIVTVTSDVNAVILPSHLKPGSVVLDVARPRDVSSRVSAERNDVLVIEGGMVDIPGQNLDFHFDFGFPPRKAFACMAETMILALDSRYEDYTLGRDLQIDKIKEISDRAKFHGFNLSGLRSFEHAVSQEKIDTVREHASKKKSL
ncbi:polysaccharide biosynthesis protein [Anaerolineales bacterium]